VQVFGNLLANALRAVADVTDGQRWVLLATSTDEEGRAIVEVRDSGLGIATADLARVFDPFYGARGRGVGLGLGLGVSQGIVSGLGGEITVESELNRGSVFRVVLPAAGGKAMTRAQETAAPLPALGGARRRILVVDDELVIGRLFARVLGSEHDVTVEHEPHAALERIRGGEDFDLIFCDVMMPDLTGPELYRLIAQTRPGLERRVVFVSGGAVGAETQEFLATTGNVVLDKPFGQEALRAFVRSRFAVHAA
jgi:two-component system cell cycle sensor histidine kinase/response regulator CckA